MPTNEARPAPATSQGEPSREAQRPGTGDPGRLGRLYDAIINIHRAILASTTRQDLLDRICEALVEHGTFPLAWIAWDDPATRTVRVTSHCGEPSGCCNGSGRLSDAVALGWGGAGPAIPEGRCLVVDDGPGAPAASPWHALARRSGFPASAFMALPGLGRTGGVLMVHSAESGCFGAREVELLEGVLGDVAAALDRLERDAQRKLAADAVLQREARYRALFEYGPDGIVILDPATARPIEFNDQACRQLGYTREEFQALTLADIEALETPEETARTIRGVLEAGIADFETLQRTKSGEVRNVHVTAQHIHVGPVDAYLAVWRDITGRKRAEMALREINQRLELAITSGSLGVWDRNLVDDSETWNDRMYELYGLEPRTHHPDYDYWCRNILHPDDRQATTAAISAAFAGNAPYDLAFRVVCPDRRIRHIQSRGLVIRDGEGRAVRVIGINRDRTGEVEAEAERQKLEIQLLRAQKMESLGRLAGGIAHDMNNVLAAILATASANLEGQPAGTPAHRAFDIIAQAAVRGGTMVKQLLTFARQHPAEIHPIQLNSIISEGIQLLERTTLSRVQVATDLAPDLRPMAGDASALANAFMNLYVNGVDAMSNHGTLTLRTRNLDDGWIEFLVADTGSGMSREVIAKAMDPFFTTKEVGKGTGLGLAMVYSTVKAHRGRVEILSEPGRGTCVRLCFPACSAPAPPAEPAPAARAGVPAGGLDLLLVDDDDLIRESLGATLEGLGHRVTASASGEEALALIESGLHPDGVILDMNMPGLGGLGVLPRLRAARPTLPVLLATGRVDQVAVDLAARHPHTVLLAKPFSIKELQRHLETLGRT